MLKHEKTAPFVKKISKVQNSRYQRFLSKRNIFISPLKFIELHNGSLRMKYTQGLYFVGFESVDKKTHAWGSSFSKAYRNFLKMFHEKYAV